MKKYIATSIMFGSFIPTISSAQYYNQGYYNYGSYPQVMYQQPQMAYPNYQNKSQKLQSYSGGTYHAPHKLPTKKEREFGHISIGADYVIGYASYAETDFTLESSLTGGEEFVSDTREFDRSLNSLSLNLGWRPLRHFGIEAFYSTALGDNKVTHTESYSQYPEFARREYEVTYKAFGIDLLGYIPINDYIEFIASIGVGKYDAKAKVKVVAYEETSYNDLRSVDKKFEDSSVAYRIGGGMQIWMSKHLTFRLMARWTQIGGEFMDYITEINAGVRYHF